MPKVKKSKFSQLNIFANSPLVIRLFGLSLVLLMMLAVGYGAYMLVKENSGDAASKKGHYGPSSKGIKHQAGFKANGKVAGLPKGDAWFANATFLPDKYKKAGTNGLFNLGSAQNNAKGKYIWYGPYTSLKPGQYLGCFHYSFVEAYSLLKNGSAVLDIYNNGKVYNKLNVSQTNKLGQSKKGSYGRTCLAFYVAKKDAKKVELRIKLNDGYIVARGTSIIPISGKDNSFSNATLLKAKDNSSIIQN